jgi:peptidoglycan/xylan/chitin deacetylase (PgdA/CDA1 family)
MPGLAEKPRAAINVDVDGLYLYDRIHGFSGSAGNVAGFDPTFADPSAWTRGVPRFLDLFARTGVRATFFTVSQDLSHPDVSAVFKDVVAAGHEIGSHSATHPYDLSRLPDETMQREVAGSRKRLQDASGQPVDGFRAPGYVLSDALGDAIAAAGHTYDSSRFPCPPYQLAKAAFIAGYKVAGRPSGSLVEPVSVWLGARKPHRWQTKSGKELVELPVGVLPGVRWPFIGTSVIAGGLVGWLALTPLLHKSDWLNFELHALDLCDLDDGLPRRLVREPALQVPLGKRWPLLVRACEDLRQSHNVRTLGEWAQTC